MPDDAAGTAVVIDVLRATTVITTALAHGADSVVTCGEVDQALELATELHFAANSGGDVLLCGERHCRRIEGFDLGNSPSEYDAQRVTGKTLVMTTTNGTRALAAASRFEMVCVACFGNLSALIDRLRSHPQLTIICSGTDGELTEEDLLLGGAIVHRLTTASPTQDCCDSSREALAQWRDAVASPQPLAQRLQQTLGGRNLVAAGYSDDIEFCAKVDFTRVVPIVTHRAPLTLRRSEASHLP